MTFEASIPYSEYLARTRIEEERNKRAFLGEEPLEPEEMLERQAVHVQGGGTVDDEAMKKLAERQFQATIVEPYRQWLQTVFANAMIQFEPEPMPSQFDWQIYHRYGGLR